jgi:ABC-type iron transport system FetAB permease component
MMADLVAAGVPADTAVGAVLALAQDADDADYIAFRRNVQRDIELGASPAAALAVRIRSATDMANAPGSETVPGPGGSRKRKP